MGTANRYFVFVPFSEVRTIKKTERCLCEQEKTNKKKGGGKEQLLELDLRMMTMRKWGLAQVESLIPF